MNNLCWHGQVDYSLNFLKKSMTPDHDCINYSMLAWLACVTLSCRFRTQMCQQGAGCKRPLCFFAHNLQELRFAEGQLQRGGPPGAQDPSAGPAAAAAAGVQANLLPGLADARQQQAAAAAAAAAALGAAPYMPALVPYALMSPTAATANLPPLQGGGGLMAAALAGGAGMQQGRPVGAGQALQQQQAWLPGFITPQGYVVLGNAQGQLLPGGPMVGGGDIDPGFQQQQQQQQYLPTASQWHHGGTAGAPAASSAAAAAAVAACMPMAGSTSGYNALHLDPALDPALMSSQLSVVPDEQVLLSQTGGVRGGDSSSSFAMLQQQQQQHQQQRQQQDAAAAAAAAAVSGSGYSWSLNPVAPSTTSASVSMSVLSVPTVGLSSSASVPGSSNNSLSHIKPGQSGAPVSLDVLQATMQQMSMRDCHVRDL